MSAEQGDVAAIREAIFRSRPVRGLEKEHDEYEFQQDEAAAALDRLAAALSERHTEDWMMARNEQKARAEKAEQAWEDMRAYNIRLEERAREAERALGEMRKQMERIATGAEWNPPAEVAEVARAALRSEDTSDES